MIRRNFLFAAASIGVAGAWAVSKYVIPGNQVLVGDAGISQLGRDSWQELVPNDVNLPDSNTPLDVTESEWAEQLPDDAFRVLFKGETERPGSSALNNEEREGVYACRACSLPLFSSAMKFESGTGWPSFFTAIDTHLATSIDYKLLIPRTEYHCIRCGGHQGHLFSDGPEPTGQRWCNNGVALEFIQFV